GDMPLLITVRTRWWSGGSSLSRIIGWPISSNGGRVELNVRQARIMSSIWSCRPVAQTSYCGEEPTGPASRVQPAYFCGCRITSGLNQSKPVSTAESIAGIGALQPSPPATSPDRRPARYIGSRDHSGLVTGARCIYDLPHEGHR